MERKLLGLSVRSWIAVEVLAAALITVLGYRSQLVSGHGLGLTCAGLALGIAGIAIGAFPVGGNRRQSQAR
ncbi:MAG: hypothetical protein ONB23_10235 [candidate division KSB1 bacterium]|nr:hypothetical protein [candidate division KSB1 bacterium]